MCYHCLASRKQHLPSIRAFSLLANKSVLGCPNLWAMVWNTSGFKCHSVVSLIILDSSSAATLAAPGTCVGRDPDVLVYGPHPNSSRNRVTVKSFATPHVVEICHCCGIVRLDKHMHIPLFVKASLHPIQHCWQSKVTDMICRLNWSEPSPVLVSQVIDTDVCDLSPCCSVQG